MKIEIQNLGPIHHFEFDLDKDLHLLYGENNVGKSFAVNVVYAFVKNLIYDDHFDSLRNIVELFTNKEIEISFKKIEERFSALKAGEEVSVNDFVKSTIISAFNHEILISIKDYFDQYVRKSIHLKNSWVKKKPTVVIQFNRSKIQFAFENTKVRVLNLDLFTDYTVTYKKSPLEEVNIFNLYSDKELIAQAFNWQAVIGGAWAHFISELQKEVRKLFEEAYFLPSSRSGLMQALEKSPKNLFTTSHLSESTLDFIFELADIDAKNTGKKIFDDIAKTVEEKILKGKVLYNEKKKVLTYTPHKTKLSLELTETASLVSEIAPLVAYIRYILQKDDIQSSLIIIEEPEAHLHPKVQVQLMEIFAELTKHNVKVILTSHSNYMFNQLSNMLLKKEIAPEKVAVYHMVMTDKGSIVKSDMQATAEGIEDHNFAGVAQQLYQERLETYDLLNEDPDADK